MVTSSGATAPASGLSVLPALLRMVRFSHTVFALPFAFAGALLAEHAVPGAATLLWILLAMVGARSLAMALNRLIDSPIDARNPRTAARELPTGRLSRAQVGVFAVASLVLLLVAVSQLPPITWVLWPVPVALFVLYPFTKRFTWACHLVLGITIGLAPLGGWIAVTGEFGLGGVLLFLAVAAWMTGLDIIYALLDVDFDRAAGLHSVPATFGARRAMMIARACHVITVALLAAVGLASDAGLVYMLGVAVCAGILAYENATVDPADPLAINRAFQTANMAMSTTYLVAVLLEVTLF